MDQKILLSKIDTKLSKSNYDYEREPFIGGVKPDFVVYGPGGQTVVIEAKSAKSWQPGTGVTNRANNNADHLRELTKADDALMVIGDLKRSYVGKGAVTLSGLEDALTELFEKGIRSKSQQLERASSERTVFAAMPFAPKYDDTYLVAMTFASKAIDTTCIRTDQYEYTGDIVNEIESQIKEASAVIVDMSETKPNVLFEFGYAHGLGKPIAVICSSPINELPFDVQGWNVIKYNIGQTTHLKTKLAKRLEAIV
jgi:nucleoside 2-deoxyribosyltransferase